MSDLIARAYAAIDRENADDPKTVELMVLIAPRALVYGERMTMMLETVQPHASDALKIACRAPALTPFDLPRRQLSHGQGRLPCLAQRAKSRPCSKAAKSSPALAPTSLD